MSGGNTSKQHTAVSHLKDVAEKRSIAWDWATWMAYSENKHGKFKLDLLLIAYVMYLVIVMPKIRYFECDDFPPQ